MTTPTHPQFPEYPAPLKKRCDAMLDEEIAKALWATKGLQAHAAQRLDCSPSALSERILNSPYLLAVRADAREIRKDNCEKALDGLVDNMDTTGIIFALKTLCKDRGYAQDTVVVDATDPVKVLMAQIKNQSKDLVNDPRP